MNSLLHYPGGKKRIAPWIISYMPPHHSYLEPYFGCGGVFFQKTAARIETINDLDGDVVNFFRVIQDPVTRGQLQELLIYTPYARQVYDETFRKVPADKIEQAGYFVIRSMQSHGFRLTERCGWKKDVYGREAAYAVRYFNELPENIAYMAARLKGVQIENRPAIELIRAFSHPNVLIYIDPPYVLSTRGRKQYRYEMEDAEHVELLEEICRSKAMVMLSGYDCELYQEYLSGWHKEQIGARAQHNLKRTETLWMNFEPKEVKNDV
ncbi:MAG: DNA adenine methylase [Clostridiaceae bacterium]|nr:DNA adenine methylase [Clostridiaceae bacterium]